MGIEPTYPAWKAGVLPLNYTRRCPVPESNQRHKDFQSFALPTELTGLVAHNKDYFKGRNLCCQAKMKIINKEEYLHSSSAVPLRHSRPEHNSHGDCGGASPSKISEMEPIQPESVRCFLTGSNMRTAFAAAEEEWWFTFI